MFADDDPEELFKGYTLQIQSWIRKAPRTATPQQRIIYALISDAFHRSWGTWFQTEFLFRLTVPFQIMLLLVISYWPIWVIGWLVGMVWFAGSEIVLWALVAVLLGVGWQQTHQFEDRLLAVERGERHRLNLARLDSAFARGASMEYGLLFALIGCQMAMLQATPYHLGTNLDKLDWSLALRYTLDNVYQGVFGDVFELYRWVTRPELHHTVRSATAFLVFRLTFTGLALLWMRSIWLRFRAGGLHSRFPAQGNYRQVAAWLRGLPNTERSWILDHFDEYLFLRICGEFLAGNYAVVRRLTAQFPRLRVDSSLRRLFVDAAGRPLFEGYPASGVIG